MWALQPHPMHQTPPCNTRPHRWLLLVMLPLLLACPLRLEAGTTPLRVLLLANLATLQISVPPQYRIVTRPASPLASESESWPTLQLQAHHGRISVSPGGLELSEIEIIPLAQASVIFVGGKLYRGNLTVKGRESGLMLVNTVDLEEYLYGVLPHEVPVRWERAVLRAQAIVARTYALYKRKANGTAEYDVSAQYLQDQRYDGYGAEHPLATQAVDDTRGLVLTCAGALIPAYYHAESAGSTENSEHVWSSAHPCLRAVKAEIYPTSPYLQWSATLALPDIRAALQKNGYRVGAIQHLGPRERSPTGRIMRLKITHAQGEMILRGTDFRMALGPEVIRCTGFTVVVRGGRALFTGLGWGHGVGMCQWCSQAMAELGYDYEGILKHHYQGAELIRYR